MSTNLTYQNETNKIVYLIQQYALTSLSLTYVVGVTFIEPERFLLTSSIT